ncbi:MAG: cyclic nucleotide-binding domain-containing protein [Spirochaetes bacterium]|nr:cyclic nucleotide-binding domain-containing protein [Spirochaetota bacterium]
MENHDEVLEKLKKIVLFSDFVEDNDRLLKVLQSMKKQKFYAGEIIIEEGDIGDRLYILYKGTVRILRKTLNNEQYTVAILNSDMNIFFGEIALIDNDKRSATVLTETNCETLYIDSSNFSRLCEEDPFMGYKITTHIAKRLSAGLRKMNKDVVTLYQALIDEVEGVI